jgi:ABC-type uncharacterized transport system fused permease/ATPase subunit
MDGAVAGRPGRLYPYAEVQLVTRVADEFGAYVEKLKADAERTQQRELERKNREEERRLAQMDRELDRVARLQAQQDLELEQQKAEYDAYIELVGPKPIPPDLRFEHTHILGPSGSGKTTLILRIILGLRPN